jgi:HEAT repeat protein
VDVLGKLREEHALPALLKLAEHQDPEVRKTVLTALSGYGGPPVQKAVLARLSDPHWSVRKAAVDLLRERRDAAAEPLLERIAEHDPDHIVRQAAREALGR